MIATLFAFWLGGVVPELRAVEYDQPSAALWKDQLFVVNGNTRSKFGSLYRGPFRSNRASVPPPTEYGQTESNGLLIYSPQAKFEIRGDRLLWFTAGSHPLILPMSELPCLEASEFGKELCRMRHGEGNNQSWLTSQYSGSGIVLLFPDHRKPDVSEPQTPVDPDTGASEAATRSRRRWDYTHAARFDVQIAGPQSVRLFHAHKDALFVSIEPDYLNNRYLDKEGHITKNLPKPPERELRTGKLPAEFTERFAAYTAEKRDYLVTTNGKVYMAVPKGKAEVEVTKVWDDPKRRIVGVVQDQANDAVYGWGFVTDSTAPERFYVKLDPKPVAVAYKLTVPLWGDRSDAYLESYECARAFRTAGEKR